MAPLGTGATDDAKGVAGAAGAMAMLGLALWLFGTTRSASPRGRGVGALGSLFVLIAALSLLTLLRGPAMPVLAVSRTFLPSEP